MFFQRIKSNWLNIFLSCYYPSRPHMGPVLPFPDRAPLLFGDVDADVTVPSSSGLSSSITTVSAQRVNDDRLLWESMRVSLGCSSRFSYVAYGMIYTRPCGATRVDRGAEAMAGSRWNCSLVASCRSHHSTRDRKKRSMHNSAVIPWPDLQRPWAVNTERSMNLLYVSVFKLLKSTDMTGRPTTWALFRF